jgi:L-ascorbate metabolism protein UlaG (beta-lactamase superfamily)
VGFVIEAEGRRVYYPGDTDAIPEMDAIRADIVLIPVGGTYTMTAVEAADAVNRMKPVVAVPIHYGDIVGSLADAKKFKEYSKVPVEIKPVTD